jgi:hypothetical protein
MSFELYVIPLGGYIKHVNSYPTEEIALEAFDKVVEDGKVRVVFLDKVVQKESPISVKVWRKRKYANQARGQGRSVRQTA